MLHKRQKQLLDLLPTKLTAKPIERRVHHVRVKLLPVLRDDEVTDFVDEPHGEQLTGMDSPIGVFAGFADLIHAVREGPARTQIGENNVAVVGKKRVFELVALPYCSRNMKFHHETPRSVLSMPCVNHKPSKIRERHVPVQRSLQVANRPRRSILYE